MKKHSKYQIICDGSCSPNPGPGGWGAIVIDESTDKRVEIAGFASDTTNNRMELTALIRGLGLIKGPSSLHVTTDSQYMANAFRQVNISGTTKMSVTAIN